MMLWDAKALKRVMHDGNQTLAGLPHRYHQDLEVLPPVQKHALKNLFLQIFWQEHPDPKDAMNVSDALMHEVLYAMLDYTSSEEYPEITEKNQQLLNLLKEKAINTKQHPVHFESLSKLLNGDEALTRFLMDAYNDAVASYKQNNVSRAESSKQAAQAEDATPELSEEAQIVLLKNSINIHNVPYINKRASVHAQMCAAMKPFLLPYNSNESFAQLFKNKKNQKKVAALLEGVQYCILGSDEDIVENKIAGKTKEDTNSTASYHIAIVSLRHQLFHKINPNPLIAMMLAIKEDVLPHDLEKKLFQCLEQAVNKEKTPQEQWSPKAFILTLTASWFLGEFAEPETLIELDEKQRAFFLKHHLALRAIIDQITSDFLKPLSLTLSGSLLTKFGLPYSSEQKALLTQTEKAYIQGVNDPTLIPPALDLIFEKKSPEQVKEDLHHLRKMIMHILSTTQQPQYAHLQAQTENGLTTFHMALVVYEHQRFKELHPLVAALFNLIQDNKFPDESQWATIFQQFCEEKSALYEIITPLRLDNVTRQAFTTDALRFITSCLIKNPLISLEADHMEKLKKHGGRMMEFAILFGHHLGQASKDTELVEMTLSAHTKTPTPQSPIANAMVDWCHLFSANDKNWVLLKNNNDQKRRFLKVLANKFDLNSLSASDRSYVRESFEEKFPIPDAQVDSALREQQDARAALVKAFAEIISPSSYTEKSVIRLNQKDQGASSSSKHTSGHFATYRK
jgi:hypothetical protein